MRILVWVTIPVLIFVIFSNIFASEITWISNNEYRLILSTKDSYSKYSTVPLSFTMEQGEISNRFNINLNEINLNSIRVVQYDTNNKPVKRSIASIEEQYYIPFHRNDDLSSNKLRISWRVNVNDANTFAIYFSRKGYGLQYPMVEIPVIGDGMLDLFLGGEDGKITCFHRAFIEDDLPILRLVETELHKTD